MKAVNKIFQGDRVVWMVVAFLSIASLLSVYSAVSTLANTRYDGNSTFALIYHAATLLLGLIVMFFVHRMKYTDFSFIFKILIWVSLILLIYTLVLGANVNDARRAVRIFGIVSFQPSDLAKIALIGYVARMLTIKQDDIKDFKTVFVSMMLPIYVIVGLIFPENLSTAAILFVCCLALLFVGRISFKYLMIFVVIGIFMALMYMFVTSLIAKNKGRTITWGNRIELFLSDNDDSGKNDDEIVITDENFQSMHAKIAVASGGLLGKGSGRSTQRNVLPHSSSDFVYAIILEEYGLLGGFFVLMLYMVLLYRAIAIIVAIPQSFGGFLAFGLTFLLVMQALIHMGVSVGILPVTGQPLPLVSKGGTSMLFTGAAFGIILSVSKEVNRIRDKKNEIESTTESDN